MTFFQKIKFRSEMKKHIKRPLDIKEILLRDTDTNVVIDSYEFFMRQYQWEIDNCYDPIVKNFLLCVMYDGEVGNGGISQFLAHSDGKYAYQVADALHTIGAIDAEMLLRKSFTLLPDEMVPEDDDLRSQMIDRIYTENTVFNQLDIEAYNMDIDTFCYRYIMNNKSYFIG